MRTLDKGAVVAAACLLTALSIGCQRGPESSRSSEPKDRPSGAVRDDLKGVAKETQKTAQDVGRATADLAEKAGQHLEQLGNEAGAKSQDAWITTKVKTALTSQGLDPLHLHVDTNAKVVTLSGTVPTAAEKDRALSAARTVTDVADVKDHLFVKSSRP